VKCKAFLPEHLFWFSGSHYKKELRNTYGKTCSMCREKNNRQRRVAAKEYKRITVAELIGEFELDVLNGQYAASRLPSFE
jgi:hypothetical protein